MPAHRFRPTDAGATDVEAAMMLAIESAPGPIGARDIRRALTARGCVLSEATVSRRLRELDERGLTRPIDRKGRLLTADGTRVLASRLRGLEHGTLLDRIADVSTATDVVHLLQARRAVEPEAVRGGVGRADPASMARLRAAARGHREVLRSDGQRIPRALILDFHRTVTSFTDNPLVASMTRIALDPSLDHVEATLDIILQSRHTSLASVEEHARICEAFVAGDGEGAATAMYQHLDRLTAEAVDFIESHDSGLIDRLLETAVPSVGPLAVDGPGSDIDAQLR